MGALSLVVVAACTRQAEGADLACHDLPDVLKSYWQHHYTEGRLSQALRERTEARFLELVDPSKTYFLAPELPQLRRYVSEVHDGMRRDACDGLSRVFAVVLDRAEEDLEFVRGMLGPSYKIDDKVELQLDPDERGAPPTQKARLALLEKLVHFQMSNYLLGGVKLPKAKKQLIHRYELVVKRLGERRSKMPEVYAEAVASAMDPHSAFMSQDTLEDFQIHMRLSLEGIGAALTPDNGFTVIESLIPGGQAEKSGKLQPKDKIIAVRQEGGEPVSVIDMALRDVVKLIRGKKGTKVTLTILREGDETERFDVTIVRDKIDVKEQAAKINYDKVFSGKKSYKVATLELPSFYGGGAGEGRSSYHDVRRLLMQANRRKVDALVLDLTKNGGGLLEGAVQISGLFIRKGAVVGTKDAQERFEVLEDEDAAVYYSGPLVVLISRASASAAEILAGALKAYGRAVVVGDKQTFGKGTVQALIPLPRALGAIKVTTGMFFLPSGQSTQQRGVAASIELPTLFGGYDLGEASLEHSLHPQSVSPFLSRTVNFDEGRQRYQPVSGETIQVLSRRSLKRRKGNKDFAALKAYLAERANKKDKSVRLGELRAEAKSKKDDGARKDFEKWEKALLGEAKHIAADLAQTLAHTRMAERRPQP